MILPDRPLFPCTRRAKPEEGSARRRLRPLSRLFRDLHLCRGDRLRRRDGTEEEEEDGLAGRPYGKGGPSLETPELL